MRIMNYNYIEQHFKEVINELIDTHEPIKIEPSDGKSVVIMDGDDFESLIETAYLLRSPANAERLRKALEEFEAGKGIELDAKAIMDAKSFG